MMMIFPYVRKSIITRQGSSVLNCNSTDNTSSFDIIVGGSYTKDGHE